MISRQFNSPGVELNEIDKSQYGAFDRSAVNTTTLAFGFADKGDDYDTKWVLSLRDFVETYGYPTNEAERYFYNTAKTVFEQGGRFFANKLPYDNNSKDKYSFVGYHVNYKNTELKTVNELGIPEVSNLDPSIQLVCEIKSKEPTQNSGSSLNVLSNDAGLIDMDLLDSLITRHTKVNLGDIVIVDMTRRRYGRNSNLEAINNKIYQYLGIVPVITTAVNALYYQYMLDSPLESLSSYSAIGHDAFKTLPNGYGNEYLPTTQTVKDELSTFSQNLDIVEDNTNSDTVNKTAALLFPSISYASSRNFEKDYLKQIGIVVFKMMLDPANNNKINFIPVEVFTGSLNHKAKNIVTNENLFIDNIVNRRSQYINMFSNVPFTNFDSPDFANGIQTSDIQGINVQVRVPSILENKQLDRTNSLGETRESVNEIRDRLSRDLATATVSISGEELKNAINGRTDGSTIIDDSILNPSLLANATERCDIFYIGNQTITSLGFYLEDCKKNISVNTSILKPMDIAFKNLEDPNRFRIDIIADAGVSNIAQYVHTMVDTEVTTEQKYLVDDVPIEFDPTSTIYMTKFNSVTDRNTGIWRRVIERFDNFTKNVRKDCIFVADGPRHFCISGSRKIIRKTAPRNTIKDTILPGVKYMTAFNSSYSCGYSDWFYAYDDTARDFFWCPPSIKAVGQFIYTDRLFAPWHAPAGITRGVIKDVFDVAFTPNPREAEVIYNGRWNYAISYPLDGITLEGQKTFQKEKTALDRINVRRLMLMIEKDVREIGKYFKYEGLTTAQINRFRDVLIEYLTDIKNRGGIKEFDVVCDETNNTVQTIENNEMHATIGVIPVKTAEWIIINAICANQSANIEELTQTYAV